MAGGGSTFVGNAGGSRMGKESKRRKGEGDQKRVAAIMTKGRGKRNAKWGAINQR